MSGPSLQFRALYRLSLSRFIDLEIIASRVDLYGLFARASGVLLSLSLTLVLLIAPSYVRHPGLHQTLRAWNDEEFLLSITLAVVGIASVLAWNNVLPDRRDCLVLGTLPVRVRTIALARLAAVATCLSAIIFMINALTGITFPFLLSSREHSLRSLAAWWITVFAAGAFVFCWTLAVQGSLAQILPWSLFLRTSAGLQMVSFFIVLGLFFLTPPISTTLTASPRLAEWLPSFWFTGLLHSLRGDSTPALAGAARLAVRNLGAMLVIGMSVFALSWHRQMRSIVETPDISSGSGQSILALWGSALVKAVWRHPLDRAILLFSARIAARSRQHRLLLAAYGGIGFAVAITFSRGLFGVSARQSSDHPTVPRLVCGILLVVCAVMAMRAIFVLPCSVSSNWILRLTLTPCPSAYHAAVRRTLITLGALPSWIVCGSVYFTIWPAHDAAEAVLVLILLGLILVDASLHGFRKIPFACSWLPASGQSVNTVRALARGLGFLISASALGALELAALHDSRRFTLMCGVLTATAVWLWWRARDFASSPAGSIQFEEQPVLEISALDLRPDGVWSS